VLLGCSCVALGRSWSALGVPSGLLECSWDALVVLLGLLGCSWDALLWCSWGALGAPGVALGMLLWCSRSSCGALGSLLGRSWDALGALGVLFGCSCSALGSLLGCSWGALVLLLGCSWLALRSNKLARFPFSLTQVYSVAPLRPKIWLPGSIGPLGGVILTSFCDPFCWGALCALGALLGCSCGALGSLLGCSWGALGALGVLLGCSCGALGVLLVLLGVLLGCSCGALGSLLGCSCGALGVAVGVLLGLLWSPFFLLACCFVTQGQRTGNALLIPTSLQHSFHDSTCLTIALVSESQTESFDTMGNT
jgi:hypothetical protein